MVMRIIRTMRTKLMLIIRRFRIMHQEELGDEDLEGIGHLLKTPLMHLLHRTDGEY